MASNIRGSARIDEERLEKKDGHSEEGEDEIDSSVNNNGNTHELATTTIEITELSQYAGSASHHPTVYDSDSSELSDPPESEEFDGFEFDLEVKADYQQGRIPQDLTQNKHTSPNAIHDRDLREASYSPLSSISSLSPATSPKRERFSEEPTIPTSKEEPQSSQLDLDTPIKSKTPKKRKYITKSPYFSPKKPEKKARPARNMVSCIPFPPLDSPHFGLLQEKFAHDPFWLLIGITFLKRTHGKYAIPVFYQLYTKYKTIENLAQADHAEVKEMIRNLGLQDIKARQYIDMANIWLRDPPVKGKRYRTLKYPSPEDGRDIKLGEILSDEDPRIGAWEIAHLPGSGDYAIDSWRIFCRDVLRGLAEDYDGKDATAHMFEPEWMRVVPRDKELRAFLRWKWLKEGWDWSPLSGEKEVADEGLVRAAREGKIVWDNEGGILIKEEEGKKYLGEVAEKELAKQVPI